MAVDQDGALVGVVTVAGDDDGGEFKVLFAGLFAEGSLLYFGSEGCEFVGEELGHLVGVSLGQQPQGCELRGEAALNSL